MCHCRVQTLLLSNSFTTLNAKTSPTTASAHPGREHGEWIWGCSRRTQERWKGAALDKSQLNWVWEALETSEHNSSPSTPLIRPAQPCPAALPAEDGVEQPHPGPSAAGCAPLGITRGVRAVTPAARVRGRGNGEVPLGFLLRHLPGDVLPMMYTSLCVSRTGESAASKATAEPSCLEHKILSSPGDLSAWYRPAERGCAARAGRCLCDSGAAILGGRSCPRSWLRARSCAEVQAQPEALLLAPARSCRRLRRRPGAAWAKRASAQFFHPSLGRFRPPPLHRDLYASRPP